ncbi:serine--tRNA ligase [Paracoccaceae bacterium]|nr:serine--tRNA ligase [Paracoccaceae bacterium]
MHDIKLIRKSPEIFDAALEKRGESSNSSKIIALDTQRRQTIEKLEHLLSERKNLSKRAGISSSNNEIIASEIREAIKKIKTEIGKLEATLRAIEKDLQDLLLNIPNVLSEEVPLGQSEKDNVEIYRWGEIKSFAFKPKEHFEVDATKLDINFETAAIVSGSRFVLLSKSVALLHRALTQYMLNTHIVENELTEFWVPVLVNEQSMVGTGQLPKFKEDSYKTNDGLWLIPTAEVPLTNIGKNKIYRKDELPIRMTASTQCFRSEAGSAGKDTTGMVRQHQFEKVEMVTYCKPELENVELERMTECAEKILKNLFIPFRKILLCSGDTGFGSKKTYDLEVWLPGQNRFREISSCSICGDFQSRRINIRYKNDQNSKPEFVSTLNGSGIAIGRCLIAVIENYQLEDGSVIIPEVLRPYMFNYQKINRKGDLT